MQFIGHDLEIRREPGGGVARRRPGTTRTAALTLLLALMAGMAGCDTGGAGSGPEVDQPTTTEAVEPAAADPGLADDNAKASYSLGYRFAENVQRQFPEDIEADAFVRGVRDKLSGEAAKVGDDEAQRVLTALMETRQARANSQALDNLEEGLAFLEKNAERDEVVTLESGLQYEVLEEGQGGEKPTAADTVTTHYEGRLIDGTVFDSSYQRGEPVSFPLNRVIAGWTEGLQLMSPGAKYRLYVPSELAYGDSGAGQIPPNSTLIFDVELLEVASPGEAATDGAAGGDPADGDPESEDGSGR